MRYEINVLFRRIALLVVGLVLFVMMWITVLHVRPKVLEIHIVQPVEGGDTRL